MVNYFNIRNITRFKITKIRLEEKEKSGREMAPPDGDLRPIRNNRARMQRLLEEVNESER